MLVRFVSSETGELLMFAEAAKVLLQALGKETTARGVFTQPEMSPAAQLLKEAVARADRPTPANDDTEETGAEPVVTLDQRAWPLIDMLERSSRGGAKANIVWEAPQAF